MFKTCNEKMHTSAVPQSVDFGAALNPCLGFLYLKLAASAFDASFSGFLADCAVHEIERVLL